MTTTVAKAISKTYVMLALAAAVFLTPAPYLVFALGLLGLHLVLVRRPPRAGLDLVLTFSTLVLVPVIYETVLGTLAAVLVVPAVPLLDASLRGNALVQRQEEGSKGRKLTSTSKALAAALLAALAVCLIFRHPALGAAVGVLALYLIGLHVYVFLAVPREPLEGEATRLKVIAGTMVTGSTRLRSRAGVALIASLVSQEVWGEVAPARAVVLGDELMLKLAMKPPLSGPSRPLVTAYVFDAWGLTQTRQELKPVDLFVIPRVRYAEWLARKFLAKGVLNSIPVALPEPLMRATVGTGRGVEYVSSRPYQPGDNMRDIDWKRLCKLNGLVVKEYSQAQNSAAIVAANLTATDVEQADKLASTLITLVLTLAKTGRPAALAVYNRERVLLTTGVAEPSGVLKKTLKVAQEISVSEDTHRFLQPPDISRLRRSIAQLHDVSTDSSQRLLGLLRLESQALQEAASRHPAAEAIVEAAGRVPPPATVAVVSPWSHDAEALAVTLDRLERQGYNTVTVDATEKT